MGKPFDTPAALEADTAAIDFYLSEMAVSDRHGGGITLQRVLGSDLDRVKRFVCVSRFAADLPSTPALEARTDYLVPFFDRDRTRALLGRGVGGRVHRLDMAKRVYASWAARRIAALAGHEGVLKALVCPQATAAVQTLEALKRRRPVDYVSWIMDDHAVRREDGEWRYPPGYRDTFAKHLREASAVFTISPTLREHYLKEFGVDSQVMFSPADVEAGPVYQTPTPAPELSIGYFGSVSSWQLDALVRVAQCLDAPSQRLHVYSASPRLPDEMRLPGVVKEAPIPKEAVTAAMRRHDAVLIPISFEESQRHLSEFNIATKMSECLASGTVTVVCGPAYAAMVTYLQGKDAAAIFTGEGGAAWSDQVRAIKDVTQRRRLLDGARRLVEDELGTAVMRRRWRAGLMRAGLRG